MSKAFTFLITVLLLNLIILFAKTIDPEFFFNQIKEKNDRSLPDFFKARIESSVVDLQKKSFPPEMIIFNQEPILYLYFKKGHPPVLYLEGVTEFYANYFAPYEEIIQNTGIFLGVDNFKDYKKFSLEYQIKVEKISYGFRFKVKEREGLPGDYGEYYYNENLKLSRIDFYKQGQLNGNMRIFFKNNENGKSLPSKAIVSYEKPEIGGLKDFSIIFTDFETDPKFSEKFFLE